MGTLRKIVCGLFALIQMTMATPAIATALPNSVMRDGEAALGQRQYPRAVQIFEHCLATSKPDARTVYLCALANYRNKNIGRAKQLLTYLSNTFPNDAYTQSGRKLCAEIFMPGSTFGMHGSPMILSTAKLPSLSSGSEFDSLPQTARIRFRRGEQGHMLIDAFINGHKVEAMFDTGATGFMDTSSLTSIGMKAPSEAPTSYAKGWAGRSVPMWRRNMEVRIGDLTRTLSVGIQQNDGSGFPPLFGQDFLRGYTYSIDDQGGWITLTKKGQSPTASVNKAYDIPCVKRGQNDYVPLEANGKKTMVFIDTGAAGTIMDLGTFICLGLSIPADAPERVMGGVGGYIVCREVELDLKLGPINRPGFKVLVGGNGGTCIGQDFMQGTRFTVDRDRNLMRFFH